MQYQLFLVGALELLEGLTQQSKRMARAKRRMVESTIRHGYMTDFTILAIYILRDHFHQDIWAG